MMTHEIADQVLHRGRLHVELVVVFGHPSSGVLHRTGIGLLP